MKTASTRPVIVTVLAIAQICIGCFNLLILPIYGVMLWGQVAERFNTEHTWFRPLAITVEILFLVAYTGIGIGLWRLTSWARQAEIGLVAVGACASIAYALFMRPLAFASVFVFGYAVAYSWIIWYLTRPRVRLAFARAGAD